MDTKTSMSPTEMLELRVAGASYQAIAARAGVSRQRVQQLLSPPPGLRRFIVDRAKGKCERCGVTVGNSGHIHHRSHNDLGLYNDTKNLRLLCRGCHWAVHTGPAPAKTPVYIPTIYTCKRCGYTWESHLRHKPSRCARRACGSPYWDQERRQRPDSPAAG